MARDERVILLGEDIGAPGGTFGATKGLYQQTKGVYPVGEVIAIIDAPTAG